jgi:pyruvate dehydrogenase (quinone)/pyruvate oxidase
MLQRNSERGFLEHAQKEMADWWKQMEERGTVRDTPMKPEVVAHELDRYLRDDAIVTCDSGTIATWAARHIRIRRGQQFSLSGNLATMANGFPYAIAAQIAYPDRQVVAFVGDGGFSMLMAELSTCVKYQLPVKIVVIKNNVLGQIKWEQMVFLGNPQYGVELEPIDHVKLAEACGASGFSITDPADCGRIMEQALSTPGPVIIEANVDPNEPPLPPKITRDQAVKFAQSLLRGEPNREKIALTALSDTVRELV